MTDQPITKPQAETDALARRAAQKRRNLWLALALFVFVVIVGVTTAIRLRTADLGPDGGLYWRNGADTTTRSVPDLPPPSDEGATDGKSGDSG